MDLHIYHLVNIGRGFILGPLAREEAPCGEKLVSADLSGKVIHLIAMCFN